MGINLNEWVGQTSVKLYTLEISLIILYLCVGILAYFVYKIYKQLQEKEND